MQHSDKPVALMAKAPLERILPFSQVVRHTTGDIVCSLEQLTEFAFLVLSGKCQETLNPPNESPRVLKTFERGEPIQNGVLGKPEADQIAIIAAEDSTVLRIRHSDLEELGVDSGLNTTTVIRSGIPVSECLPLQEDSANGRLLTLAFLSTNPPSEAIGESLAHAIHNETGESVALVCLTASNAGSPNGEREPNVTLGEHGWQQNIFKSGNGFNIVHIGVPVESITDGAIDELTTVLRRRFPWVLMACAAPELPSGLVMDFITRSDRSFLLLQRTPDDKLRHELLTRYLRSRFNDHVHDRIRTVLCLGDSETVGDFDEQVEEAGTPIHTYLHGSPISSAAFQKDIRRMARDITGRLVGLALASGGAKGFAHIGVLQVLEENGIEVDIVAGSSMGAYVGSIWAHGASGAEMEQLAHEMEGRWAIWSLIDPAFPPRRGFLRGVAVKHRLMRTIGESHFGDLVRPMRVVATNLETLERVVFTHGTVADAVHASIAVPGICVPVHVGDDTLADGGIVDPLPVDVLLEAGARRIIAVNTIPTPERIRQSMTQQRARARENRPRRRERSSKIMPFDKHLNYFARGNILEILMRSFLGVQTRMAETSSLRADVVLCPEIEDNRWVDFRNPDKYIRAGRSIALKHLDEIKSLVNENGVSHEVEQSKEPMVAIG